MDCAAAYDLHSHFMTFRDTFHRAMAPDIKPCKSGARTCDSKRQPGHFDPAIREFPRTGMVA